MHVNWSFNKRETSWSIWDEANKYSTYMCTSSRKHVDPACTHPDRWWKGCLHALITYTGEARTVEEKGTCISDSGARASPAGRPAATGPQRAARCRNAKPAKEGKNACTCPASPPRAPRHLPSASAGGAFPRRRTLPARSRAERRRPVTIHLSIYLSALPLSTIYFLSSFSSSLLYTPLLMMRLSKTIVK